MFKEMDICLHSLKKRFELSIVPSSDRTTVENMMDKCFPETFDVIVNGDDTINGKPVPDPYNKDVKMLGTENEKCIVIKNAILGVTSAKNAGVFSVGLPTHLDRKELVHADIVLQNHEELTKFMELLIRI